MRSGRRLGASGRRPLAGGDIEGAAQPAGVGASRSRRRVARRPCGPTSRSGVRWLYLLAKLGLGACLADDMGLGKTIQVLSLLLVLKRQSGAKPQPSLLVAPASLLANWAAEIERFAPGLKALIAHPSALPAAELKALDTAAAAGCRPGDHQLRLAASRAVDCGSLLASGGAGRGAGHQESGCQTDPRRQEAEGGRESWRSPARRSRTGWAICGPSSTSSTLGCWDRRKSSRTSPSGLPTSPTAPMGRCANWCGRTFCGA